MRLLVLLLAVNLFAFEGVLVKNTVKFFSKESVEIVSKRYGDDGVKALAKLESKYGKESLKKLNSIYSKYGKEGIRLLAEYGEKALKNPQTFEIVKKFKDKGFYLITKFPKRSVEYYQKFGNKFVELSNRYGSSRVIKYLDEAKQYNADGKIIKFLDKFGEKANVFLEKHWGKLLVSGFVLLNADSLIKSSENIAKEAINKTTETVTNTVTKSIDEIVTSQFGLLAGLALIVFVFLKVGLREYFKFKNQKSD